MLASTYLEFVNFGAQLVSPFVALAFFTIPGLGGIAALLPYLSFATMAAGGSYFFHGFFQATDERSGVWFDSSKANVYGALPDDSSDPKAYFNKKVAGAEIGMGALLAGYGLYSYMQPTTTVMTNAVGAITTTPLFLPIVTSTCLVFMLAAWAQFMADCFVFGKLKENRSVDDLERRQMQKQAVKQFVKAATWTALFVGSFYALPMVALLEIGMGGWLVAQFAGCFVGNKGNESCLNTPANGQLVNDNDREYHAFLRP